MRKQILILAALASAFSPLYPDAPTRPAQLSEQEIYGPIAELDRLAFKNKTVANDSFGRPYITPLGLALRTYAQDHYRQDETVIDEGVIKNICLYSHVVSELAEKAHLQAGRAAFARETLTLKKQPALLQKQASIRAFDPSFKEKTQKLLTALASSEKIFLEIATQQYELSPISIELTRILGPLNWAVAPLMLLAYGSTMSQAEAKVLRADAAQDRENLYQSRYSEGGRLTPLDQMRLLLNEYLFKDTRKAALVGTVAVPLIGGLLLATLEGSINRWGHENINELKKNHQLYSLLYQVTEGLQLAGDATRFAFLWTLMKPGSFIPKKWTSLLDPAAARNGSTIFTRYVNGLKHWQEAGSLATLIERKQALEEQVKTLKQDLMIARNKSSTNPQLIERLEASLEFIEGTTRGSRREKGELQRVQEALVEEKARVEPTLRDIDNDYFAQEHKAYIATLQKVQAQLGREEHIQKLKEGVITSCGDIVKAAQLAESLNKSRTKPAPLFEEFCKPLTGITNPQEIQEVISIPAHELKEHVAHWFDEVITEFKENPVELSDTSPLGRTTAPQTLHPQRQPAQARDAKPRVSEAVDKKWKEIIRTVLSEQFTTQEDIIRGAHGLNMTQHAVANFYTDDQTSQEEALFEGFLRERYYGRPAALTPDEKILRKITLSGAQRTALLNLFGLAETTQRLASNPVPMDKDASARAADDEEAESTTFKNPIGAAAYNHVLNHNTDGTLTSPTSYWMLRGAQAAIPPVIAGTFPALNAAKNIFSWWQKNSEIQPVRKLLVNLSHYVRGASSLYRHIADNKELMGNLPPHISRYFDQFFGKKAHPALAEIITLCEHPAFNKAEGFLWHFGALGRLIDLLNEHMTRFQELSQAVGYIDYLAILSDMIAPETAIINNEGQKIQWCFPSIIETPRPYINFKGMWYPGYKPTKVISTAVSLGGENNAQHLIITGVNGCGKSIVMSAMMSVVVFAHTHGIAPAEQAELCPFDLVMFHGNIDDAKIDGYSKGIAEILHSGIVLKKIVEQMNKQGQKLRAYITMDELFCSTDQETATTLAKVILDVIMQDPQAMLVFTTHNKELTALEKETHGQVKNAYVDTDIDVVQEKVIYKRQLREGVNNLSPALFIMKERFKESGVRDPFVLGILDKAIAYQKTQKGFGKQAA